MKFRYFVLPLAVPAILAGGLVGAEKVSADSLTGELRSRITDTLPDSRVEDINLRGRPYIVSRFNGEVSTAYLRLSPPEGVSTEQLLVQELDLETGKAERLTFFVTLPYPDGSAATPVLRTDGSYTGFGRLDGQKVSYPASLDDRRLTVRPTAGAAPEAVRVPAVSGLRVAQSWAAEDGIHVELTADDVATRS
ncbi:hypothetical protein [Flexivirga meconopsidis]|uniref:hypothetical protein n=1 Tax=Flexivirga meconopsidis TaxID=2977121 RepID=UPI002240388E|nr:hypothetical protein [Flexivirga meconopsidis]